MTYTDQSAEALAARPAMHRIKVWLSHEPSIIDTDSMTIWSDELAEDMQQFIRDNLDLKGTGLSSDMPYDSLRTGKGAELAEGVLNDLNAIWAYPYYRDEISQFAMNLSLCPLHFCDWAACFDDEIDECAQIRAIFPYSHDT